MSGESGGEAIPRRVKITLAYDGTNYSGSQMQPTGPTIQSTVEEALGRHLDEPVRIRTAGRTDAGVHARAQAADFADRGRRDLATIVKGGNALLPGDIRILSAEAVPPGFDARRHATGKEYRYFLHLAPVGSPFLSRHAWHIEKPLDLDAVKAGLSFLVGEHDFTSFRAAGCSAQSAVRRIDDAALTGRLPSLWSIDFRGSGFLRHMVRNLVGTLVDVGRGKIPPERVGELLALRDRALAGMTAPPHGLFLWRVWYGDEPVI
jgi:tRNA pseudouridine38-40 synthase